MKTVFSLDDMIHDAGSVVTVGTFDGVHCGHRVILETVTGHALRNNGRSVVVTFDPHPRDVVGKGPVEFLGTLSERLERIAAQGIDTTLVVKFTREFSQQTAEEFYRHTLLDHIGVREVIVGHDHLFGKDRRSGIAEIEQIGKEADFTAITIPPVVIDGTVVSSSAIRRSLQGGDVASAARFLGYPYELSGAVVTGDARGKLLGFPTANIDPQPGKLVPANGVYKVRAGLGGSSFAGMMNIGTRPTFEDSGRKTLEVHILDFDRDIYGETVKIQFLRRIRPEQKFSSKAGLIAQLERDREMCR